MNSFIVDLPSITAYEKNGLKITFSFERILDPPGTILINMAALNETNNIMNEFVFQAAVPKVERHHIFFSYINILKKINICFKIFQIQLMSPSGKTIQPAGQVTQVIRITNPNKVCVIIIIIIFSLISYFT